MSSTSITHLSAQILTAQSQTGDNRLQCEAIDAALDCATACEACAAACLKAPKVADFIECIRACLDCADICYATARLLARSPAVDSRIAPDQLETSRLAALRCAEICERHAVHSEVCRLCAEACRRNDVAAACLIGEAR